MSSRPGEHREEVPRAALLGAGLLIVFVLGLAAFARLAESGITVPVEEQAAVLYERDLNFVDREVGGFHVIDASDNRIVDTYEPGEAAFIRIVMRSMTRERRMRKIGRSTPFRLTGFADGSILIRDLATGREIDLRAFGIDNAKAFARLLTAKGEST